MGNKDKKAIRVLVIDDDRVIRRMYADLLRNDGYEVVEEVSAVNAVDRIANGEHFDLVITDVMMAKMDGWEFLEIVRNKLKLSSLTLPIIVVSAYFDSVVLRKDALKLGASATYTKAEPLSTLLREVRIQTGQMRSKFDDNTSID